MPIRGVILILILAVLFAYIFRNEIFESIQKFRKEEDTDETEKM